MRRALLSAVLLAAAASVAAATEDDALRPGEKVEATLSPAGERKYVAFTGVEGSKLAASASAVGKSRVVPTLWLVAPDGSTIDVGATNPKSGRRARLSTRLTATGVWRIGVESPPGSGGAFVLSASAKAPTRAAWSAGVADFPVDGFVAAAAGGEMSLVVVSKGAPRFDPTVELLSPSGASLGRVVGSKGKATLPRVALEETGRYVVRVGGGPGTFAATASLKRAKRRAPPTFHDVEAAPVLSSFTPESATNQRLLAVTLYGGAFLPTHRVQLVSDGAAVKEASVGVGATGAYAEIDLTSVAPGPYVLRVATPESHYAVASAPLVLSNRPPTVGVLTPGEVTGFRPFPLDVHGQGFDPTATVSLRHAASGAAVPLAVNSRSGSDTISVTASPPAYLTGPCDVEVRDADGSTVAAAGALDLLGYRAAPRSIRSVTNGQFDYFYPWGAAFDDARGRVLAVLREGSNKLPLVLFDHATAAVLDSTDMTPADFGQPPGAYFWEYPNVTRDPVGDTYAVAVPTNGNQALVRVVSGGNIRQTLSQTFVTTPGTQLVSNVWAAPNLDQGGYLLVWDENNSGAAPGGGIHTAVIGADGVVDLSSRATLSYDAQGRLYQPTARRLASGRYVVAWARVTLVGGFFVWSMETALTDERGARLPDTGIVTTAAEATWLNCGIPTLASDPDDGSMLLLFSYADTSGQTLPGFQRLAPVTAQPSHWEGVGLGAGLTDGYSAAVAWNATRKEYVMAFSVGYPLRCVLRRLNPDGTLRAAPVVESYEGWAPILYSGSGPNTLGFIRLGDDVEDDVFFNTTIHKALAAPIR